ncbi:hypothetical protein SVAN01_11039 [Stagonosporopsis vannaccii]|nr:hypothetical protein SVAN01_11039 [Stagonosporopsis vannaccii]
MANASTLSAPILYTRADLESEAALLTKITDLINDAFIRSKKPEPQKWGVSPRKRFPSNNFYLEMLGSDGIVGVIFDEHARDRKVVAVAAAVPWQGGWKKEGAGVEEGWEIKAVAVDGEEQYLHRGLAVQLYTFLERHVIIKSKQLGYSTTGRMFNGRDQLTLWILAAECINGRYWRGKGYELVRKDTFEAPTWGVLTSFEMVVLRKDVTFDVLDSKPGIDSWTTAVNTQTRQEVEVK